jgi:hypothetical protein
MSSMPPRPSAGRISEEGKNAPYFWRVLAMVRVIYCNDPPEIARNAQYPALKPKEPLEPGLNSSFPQMPAAPAGEN